MNLDVNELAKLVAHMNLIHRTNKRKRKKTKLENVAWPQYKFT